MGLHFSKNGIFITRMKLGDTKNHKNDPAMRVPIIGRFVRQDCQNGGLSRSRERWKTDLSLGPPEGTNPIDIFMSDVTRDCENVVFRHLEWCFVI